MTAKQIKLPSSWNSSADALPLATVAKMLGKSDDVLFEDISLGRVGVCVAASRLSSGVWTVHRPWSERTEHMRKFMRSYTRHDVSDPAACIFSGSYARLDVRDAAECISSGSVVAFTFYPEPEDLDAYDEARQTICTAPGEAHIAKHDLRITRIEYEWFVRNQPAEGDSELFTVEPKPSHLRALGAMLELLAEPNRSARNQSGVIDEIMERHPNKRGLSKRNLEDMFAAANRLMTED